MFGVRSLSSLLVRSNIPCSFCCQTFSSPFSSSSHSSSSPSSPSSRLNGKQIFGVLSQEKNERLRYNIDKKGTDSEFQNFGLLFLGSGGGKLDTVRSSPSVAVRLEKVSCLVDCGADTTREMMKSTLWGVPGMRPSRFQHIFITHLHADHVMGILSTILYLKEANDEQTDGCSLHVWGPVGIRKFIRSALTVTNARLGLLNLCIHELVTMKEFKIYQKMFEELQAEGSGARSKYSIPLIPCGDTLVLQNQKTGHWDLMSPGLSLSSPPWSHYQPPPLPPSSSVPQMTITAGEIKHSIRTFGFVFEEITKNNNNYLFEEGVKRGITQKDYEYIKKLKNGETVTLPSGQVVTPDEVIAKKQKGRKMTILGDTNDANKLAELAMDSDLVVHEATLPSFQNDLKDIGHSTGKEAGIFAKNCNAGHLVLNHLCDRGDFLVLADYVNEAKKQYDGPVICAVDHLVVDVTTEGRDVLRPGENESQHTVQIERVGIKSKTNALEWVLNGILVFLTL